MTGLASMLLGAALLGAVLVAGWGTLTYVRRQRVHRRRANRSFMAGYKAGYRAGCHPPGRERPAR